MLKRKKGSEKFWEQAEKTAEEVSTWPEWKQGDRLNPNAWDPQILKQQKAFMAMLRMDFPFWDWKSLLPENPFEYGPQKRAVGTKGCLLLEIKGGLGRADWTVTLSAPLKDADTPFRSTWLTSLQIPNEQFPEALRHVFDSIHAFSETLKE